MIEKPALIKGGIFFDERGSIRFVNDFGFEGIKRFYFIKHQDTSVIRAWQGHQFEKKYFFPISGSFVVAWVKIDNFENPSQNLKAEYCKLKQNESAILSLPKGYANGLMALEPNSEILIFSNMDLKDSLIENVRYPAEWWFDWDKFDPKRK